MDQITRNNGNAPMDSRAMLEHVSASEAREDESSAWVEEKVFVMQVQKRGGVRLSIDH